MKIYRAVPVILFLMIYGCGLTPLQKQQVTQFAAATESVAKTTQDRFKTARDKVIELERRRLIMRNEEPPTWFDIDGGLSAEGIATQMATLKALQSYGDVLNKLASNDQGNAITKAATTFLIQFEAAKQNQDAAYELDDNKKASISGVVGLVGNWFVEIEKKKKIRSIVEAYSEDIGRLAALLRNDLTLVENSLCIEASHRRSKVSSAGVMDIYCTSADAVRELAADVLKEPNHFYDERAFAYDSYILAQTSKTEITMLSAQGGELIEKLMKANDQLLSVIKEDKFTADEIRAFSRQVEELDNHMKVIAGN